MAAALTMGPAFSDARVLTPTAYSSLAAIENRGNIVEVAGAEREAVMALPARRRAINSGLREQSWNCTRRQTIRHMTSPTACFAAPTKSPNSGAGDPA